MAGQPLNAPLLGDEATRPVPWSSLQSISETDSPSCARTQAKRPENSKAEAHHAKPHFHLEAWSSQGSKNSTTSSRLSRHVLEEQTEWVSRGVTVKSENDLKVELVVENGESKLHMSVPDGSSSLMACIIALVSTCVGTGLLALPFAFSTAGVYLGMALLLTFCLLSSFSSYLLTQCCEWSTVFAYEDLMVVAFGNTGAVGLGCVIVWLLIGAMTSIVVVSADVVTQLLESLVASSAAGGSDVGLFGLSSTAPPSVLSEAWSCRHTFVMLANVFVVILPLAWGAKSPAALRNSNMIAISCTLCALLILVLTGISSLKAGNLEGGEASASFLATSASPDGPPAQWGPDILQILPFIGSDSVTKVLKVVPIIMLSLGCQVQVPCVYGDLSQRSLPRMQKAVLGVGSVCFMAYSIVGIMGLVAVFQMRGNMDFTVAANVLDSFPSSSPSAMAMRGLMAVAACAVYPMLLLPCRSTLDHLITIASGRDLEVIEEDLRCKALAETLAIMCATVLCAYCGGDLAKVFGFTGATAGSLICYLLPPACYIKLRQNRPQDEQNATRVQHAVCWCILVFMVPLSLLEVCLQFLA